MRITRTAVLIGALIAAAPAAAAGTTPEATEASLQQVDQRQSEIVQTGDLASLDALLHRDYLVHVPNGRTLDRSQILEFAKGGALSKEKHRRVQEKWSITGTTGIVFGVDHMESPSPLATRGELKRRYTNVYVFEDGRWKHLARHFHFLP